MSILDINVGNPTAPTNQNGVKTVITGVKGGDRRYVLPEALSRICPESSPGELTGIHSHFEANLRTIQFRVIFGLLNCLNNKYEK